MFIYLDESGDLGFDFNNKKSSTHFVITLLVCHDYPSTLRFRAAIQHTLRQKLNNKNHRNRLVNELKSTQTSLAVKEYFYKNVNARLEQGRWSLYSIIADKKALLAHTKTAPDVHRLYNMLAHNVLRQVDFSSVKHSVQLSVDRCKAPNERAIFNHYIQSNLEAQLSINVTLNIEHENSHCNTGLQAVDLFCWGIFRKYTLGDVDWYNTFQKHIIWEEEYKF